MRYRKKPVVIEAVQWWKLGDHPRVVRSRWSGDSTVGWIETLEGGLFVIPGDWIITEVAGEVYPCRADIFERTYEPVTDEEEER